VTLRRGALAALGLAMAASVALLIDATNGQGFAIDELFYYGRVAIKDGALVHYAHPFSPEYLLAPFNGHLALGGRFTYETVFATIGAHYTAFVVVDALGICACAALVYVFARRRLGEVAALAPALLVLFLGSAREQFLWPLDFNTSLALAAGLAAILCLDGAADGTKTGHMDRFSSRDLLACLLLGVAAAMIEVGLAFIVGAALAIALAPRPTRRVWIVAAPVVLYAGWWVWSSLLFHQGETDLANVVHFPETAFKSIAVAFEAITGSAPAHPESFGTGVTGLGELLAALALLGLIWRLSRGEVPRTMWIWIIVALTYWGLLSIAGRPPESTRYLLVSTTLVLLVMAECVRRPLDWRAGGFLVVLALLALPGNINDLFLGRDQNVLRTDIPKTRAEFAMVELAGDRVDPAYVVSADQRVVDLGGGLFLGIPAGAILDAARQSGSIAYSPAEVAAAPEPIRRIADAALVGALGAQLEPAAKPAAARCLRLRPQRGRSAVLSLGEGRVYLRAEGRSPALIGLRRFAASGPGVPLARLRPGGWTRLELPPDAAPQRWSAVAAAPLVACSLSSGAA
jgi:hypothetical protein